MTPASSTPRPPKQPQPSNRPGPSSGAGSLEQAKRCFSDLVQEHESSLFGYLSRLGLSDAAVNDVAQEAFLRAWRYRDRYDEANGQWNTWLFRIARNVAYSVMRRSGKAAIATDPVLIQDTHSHSHDPSAVAELEQKRQTLRHALLQLNDNERDVLALSYVQGLPSAEAAAIVECDAGTFRTRVSRARARLTQLLEAT